MVEFMSRSNHFHIFDKLIFGVRFANFWKWFSQIEDGSDLSNLLVPT